MTGRNLRWLTFFAVASLMAPWMTTEARAWGPHSEITQAGMDTLPAEAPLRRELGDDFSRLRQYCWMADNRRSLQREPDAWFYADDYLLFPGMTKHIDHLCPDVKQTYEPYFRRALQALRTESPRNAARWIGSILHFTEDTGSPPHAAEIRGDVHSKMENWVDAKAIHLGDYHPQTLGTTDDEAVAGFLRRMNGLIEFSKKRAERAKPFVLAGDRPSTEPIVLESALETGRVVADLLQTLGVLAAQPTKDNGTVRWSASQVSSELPKIPAKAVIRGTKYSTLAGVDGAIEFHHLPTGAYELEVFAPGSGTTQRYRCAIPPGGEPKLESTVVSGRAGEMIRNGRLDVGWLSPEQPDSWYPMNRKGEERHWESDLIPLTAGESYELSAKWRNGGTAQVIVHLLPKTLFQGIAKEEAPVTPENAPAKFQATADFPWAQVWIYGWKNPREVMESVSFAHVK